MRLASAVALASTVVGLALVVVAAARAAGELRATNTLQAAATTPAPATPATTAGARSTGPATSSTPLPPTDPADPTAQAAACTGIPSGTVPSFVDVATVATGTQVDPRTGVATREVTATLRTSAVGVPEPFSIVVVVLRAGSTAVSTSTRPLDRAGDEQLAVGSDGTHLHKGVRALTGGAWQVRNDAAASDLTYRITGSDATLFFAGLHPGDRIGVITAGAGACQASDLDSQLAPALVVH
ncbi:MAG TPA: hypothetical protein VN193_16510 [Candidatus Angelobacter sp.]|nr:hypothetical protein [Candidatus Angelobacter sp.]